jgi:hypothetical protein
MNQDQMIAQILAMRAMCDAMLQSLMPPDKPVCACGNFDQRSVATYGGTTVWCGNCGTVVTGPETPAYKTMAEIVKEEKKDG